MEPLAQLVENVHRLLERVDTLEQEVTSLRQKNEELHQDLMRAHSDVIGSQDKYRKLQIAYAMLGGEEERQQAKVHVNNMIAQLDRALEALKQ